MVQIGSSFPLVVSSVVLVAVPCKFLYDGIVLEEQTVHKFAVRIMETFKDRLAPSCREKKEEAQIVHCFLKAEGSNLISRESPEFSRDVQEYESRYHMAIAMKTMGLVMTVISAVSFYVAYRKLYTEIT